MSTFSTAAFRLPAGSLHFLQTKVPLTFIRLPFTPEQRLWTHFLHFVQVTVISNAFSTHTAWTFTSYLFRFHCSTNHHFDFLPQVLSYPFSPKLPSISVSC